jgi:hypothetical protein
METRRAYRSREGAIVLLIVAALAPLAISLPALLAVLRHTSPASSLVETLFVLLGLALCALCIRCAACAVHVDADGIRVVNPLSTRRARWDEIHSFELARWGLLPRNCVVRLVDGSRIGVWAISARNPNFFEHDRAAEGLVADLNALLSSENRESL